MPVTLHEMLEYIHKTLKESCFTDIKDETGVSESTISQWRNQPPEQPSLHVFCKLARYCEMNPNIAQLEELF